MRASPQIVLIATMLISLWLSPITPSSDRGQAGPEIADPAGFGAAADADSVEGFEKSPSATAPSALTSLADPSSSAPSGRTSLRSPAQRRPAHPLPGSQTGSENLDGADGPEIRHVLEQAVERARSERELSLSPGILDVLTRERIVRIVFSTEHASNRAALDQLLDGGRGARVEDLRVFPMLDHAAASVGPQALLNLVGDAGTASIELDAVHRPSLADTIPQIGGDVAHSNEHDGDGFVVAVLDTGTDTGHPFFAGRIVDEACFSVESDCPNGQRQMFGPGAGVPCAVAGCGHGTTVAGIAVGDDPADILVGAAPHAGLISIQIFSDVNGEPGAYSSDILAGLQHVLALTAFHPIASVNMSLGGSPYTSEASCDAASPSRLNAVALLRNAGVLTVAASGNASLTNAITIPGCLSNVISVGAVGRDDFVSSFSNSAEFLSLLAPGELIQSTASGGGTAWANGTSMATPHVAGSIAAIREALPEATAGEIENALALTGISVVDTRNGVTKPRIQVDGAIALLQSAAAPPVDPDPPVPAAGSDPASTASSSSSGGGGGCGLVGLEPFLMLGLVRIRRPGFGSRAGEARSCPRSQT